VAASGRFSRRAFCGLTGAAGIGALLAACGGAAPTPTPPPKSTSARTPAAATPAAVAPTPAATAPAATKPAATAAATAAPAAASKPAATTPAAGATPAAAPAAGKASGKVTFLARTLGPTEKMFTPIFDNFKKANPGVQVDVIYGAAGLPDHQTKLLLMISGGTPPDVYDTHSYVGAGLYSLGIPEDVTQMLKADKTIDLDKYYGAAMKDFEYSGKQTGVPRETTSTVLIYNKDLFIKAGVGFPKADWKWADYLQAVEKLTSGQGPTKQYGAAGWVQVGYMYYALIRVWQEGGDVVNEDRTKYTLDQDPGVKGFSWVNDMVQKGWHPASAQGQAGDPSQLFNTGRVAMIPSFSNYSFFDNAKFDWDIEHLPHNGKQVTRNASAGYSMTTQSKNKDAAWALTSYLFGPEAMQAYFNSGISVAYKPVAEQALKENAGKRPTNLKVGLDALSYARPEPVVGNWLGIHQTIASALEGVYGPEKKPVKETLSSVADKVNQLIAAKPTANA
jgi:multiple sugar transport system substrate-binding protein